MSSAINTEIARYFIISLPEVIANLLAAFIILRIDIKNKWKQFLIVSIIVSLYTFLTYIFIKDMVVIKTISQLLIIALLVKIFFKINKTSIIGLVILFCISVIISEIMATVASLYLFKYSLDQTLNDPQIWLKTFLPAYFLMVLLAYAIRPLGGFVKTMLAKMNFTYSFSSFRLIILAIFVQIFLLIILLTQIFFNNMNVNNLYFIFITFFLLLGLNIFILIKSITATEKKIITQNQETVSENIMGLINSIRSQRHDFINNLQIINSLLYEDNLEELKQYLSKLNTDVTFYNDLLKLDQPIISALVNAKLTKAEVMGIKVNIYISANLSTLTMKAYDITRILGNLIDNALDAIKNNSEENKWIKLSIEVDGPFLIFSITNPGSITNEIKESLFEPGFTTKDSGHSGLGLYISEHLAHKLHGKINLYSNELDTTFSFVIPK